MQKILQKILQFFAKRVIQKYEPRIIAVSGTVGKTSTRNAIYTVLKAKYRVWKGYGNYNNEIGVPLAILGARTGGKSIIGWLKVFFRAVHLLAVRNRSYPEMLVLEYAIDRKGDMDNFFDLAIPHVAVLTTVDAKYPVHLAFFENVEQLVEEKLKLLTKLPKSHHTLINLDDELIARAASRIQAKQISFGVSEKASVRLSDLDISNRVIYKDGELASGISFKLTYEGRSVPVFLPQILGQQQAYAALIAASVGVIFGMNIVDIARFLQGYTPPPGRMNLIPGVKNAMIIDDTYNAAPLSVEAALITLGALQAPGRKLACLGTMAELGKAHESAHREVGALAAKTADVLFVLGEGGALIADGALEAGMSEDVIFRFSDVSRAGIFIQHKLQQGDLLLIKGSQSMRMEKITYELMANPIEAETLLVRQSKGWL